MRRNLLCITCVVLLVGGAPQAQSQSFGLKFASREQLRTVPLAFTPLSGPLPASFDLTRNLPPPGNQGAQSSCVAWAVGYAMKSYQERIEQKWSLVDGSGNPDPSHVFSPSFIYNQINHGIDGGSLIIDALNLLTREGAVPLAVMPYDQTNYTAVPSAAVQARALPFRIADWRQVNPLDPTEVKAQVYGGYPVLIGVPVDASFQHAGPGFVWRQTGQPLGGHAMLVVGYDDARSAFKIINSWGQQWGDDGYGWIDYGLFTSIVKEAYVAMDKPSNPVAPGPAPSPSPAPSPAPVASVRFSLAQVQYNFVDPTFGPGVRFEGALSIPPGLSAQLEVVVQVYLNAGGLKGQPIRSLWPQFRTVYGTIASSTGLIRANGTAASLVWHAFIPYNALGVLRGRPPSQYQTNLIAEPVLFINGFGVRSGGLLPFYVRI